MTLAQEFDAEIVSIDSALVYRDMNIGTAKPTAEERAQVPHHLIDLISPMESYSVARFVTDCREAIAAIHSRGRMPLLVGGTMMYANMLVNGMSEVPPSDPAIRAELAAQREREGIASLHAELAVIDPITAQRLPPADTQRIERALEVWRITGAPLSSLQGHRVPALAGMDFLMLRWLPVDRAWLHRRCQQRLTEMFASGFIAEVEALRVKYPLHADLPSMRCVGYRQVLDVLEGRAPEAELFDRALFATRQLAKRQVTWLRGFEGAAVQTIECDNANALSHVRELMQQTIAKLPARASL